MNRHPAPTPEQIHIACEALAKGHNEKRAAACIGIDENTWGLWGSLAGCEDAEQAYVDFKADTDEAILQGFRGLKLEADKCWDVFIELLDDDDKRIRMEAAAFLLKHRHQVYAAKAPNKVEVSGDKERPLAFEAISPAFSAKLSGLPADELLALFAATRPVVEEVN
ncbi:hypothetical protein LCGC14_1509640 [marine sediment metagenome]|uniref:Uncharacterized protein n=1 Tax=marine sediment metagenome TaxID=412755 RepID=A0A0F9J1U6_9ZZZZ